MVVGALRGFSYYDRMLLFNVSVGSFLPIAALCATGISLSAYSGGADYETTGQVILQPSSGYQISGKGMVFGCTRGDSSGFDVQARLNVQRYPAPADRSPALEIVLPVPVYAQHVRAVFADAAVHVSEIRLFQSEFHEYPPVLSPKETPGLSNWAYRAKVTASSEYKGREAWRAVDGKIDFESRWYSDIRPSDLDAHFLELDLGEVREIGCIQMVIGYEAGDEWKSITSNFRFEYWTGQEWAAIRGSQRSLEPGSAGLVFGVRGGQTWGLVNRNGMTDNWAFGLLDADGNFSAEKTFSHVANLREQKIHLLRASQLDKNIYVWLDHQLLMVIKDVGIEVGWSGFLSASQPNEIELIELEMGSLTPQARSWLGGVTIQANGEPIEFSFDPLRPEQEVQLPSVEIDELRLELNPAVVGQMIRINGESAIDLSLTAGHRNELKIEVTSPDGRMHSNYQLTVLPVPSAKSMDLVFAEEFEGDSLDLGHWFHRTGKRWDSYVVPQSVSVGDGKLRIGLTVEDGKQKVGGVISRQKFGYGYYETRAKLWKGTGWHSAFWNFDATAPGERRQVPSNNINEIDCFESVGPHGFTTNIHYTGKGKTIGAMYHSAPVAEEFHVYAWEWTPEKVRFFFEGELIREESYLPPHGMQNVWLSCVAHPNASIEDLPGEVLFDYFRYYRRSYGNETPENAIVVDHQSDGYRERGDWENCSVAVAHDQGRSSRITTSEGSAAIWGVELVNSGRYEVFVWNTMVVTDGLNPHPRCHPGG